MIISHEYKFIFIKTNKTAGTSVEIALSRFCGPRDIITPISAEDEKTRQDLGYRGAQNYLAPMRDYTLRDWSDLIRKWQPRRRYYNHISAEAIRRYIDPSIWSGYFKFCVERNPWDRVVSLYHWSDRTEPRPTISEFLATDKPLLLRQWGRGLYTIDDKIVVDKICRFERLAADLEDVRRKLGIPEPLELPRAKSKYRSDKRSYREILSHDDREKVAQLFGTEIDQLGYEF